MSTSIGRGNVLNRPSVRELMPERINNVIGWDSGSGRTVAQQVSAEGYFNRFVHGTRDIFCLAASVAVGLTCGIATAVSWLPLAVPPALVILGGGILAGLCTMNSGPFIAAMVLAGAVTFTPIIIASVGGAIVGGAAGGLAGSVLGVILSPIGVPIMMASYSVEARDGGL